MFNFGLMCDTGFQPVLNDGPDTRIEIACHGESQMFKQAMAVGVVSILTTAVWFGGSRRVHAAAIPSTTTDATIAPPTFNKDVAPILFHNCSTCHHPGE